MTTPILLIESADSLRMVYRDILERAGNSVRCATTLTEGLSTYHDDPPCVVVLDGLLEGPDHTATLRDFQASSPGSKILMTVPQTVLQQRPESLTDDVFDILAKPFDELRLLTAVADAHTEILRARLAKGSDTTSRIPISLIGTSPAITSLRERLEAFAQSSAPVMITGENGAGKADCARHLHRRRDPSQSGTLQEIACRIATPDTLVTDLANATPETSLLLHEIDHLPAQAAQYLLERIRADDLNVRAIISTLEGSVLDALARAGQSSELIHRLNALPLNLPRLAQRQSDLHEIAEAALPELCAVEKRGSMRLSDEAAKQLAAYDWPGNIPQLINTLHQIVVLHSGPSITAQIICEVLEDSPLAPDSPAPDLTGKTLADIERTVIEQAIRQHDGSVPKAAKSLGVSPSTLYRKRENWEADA